MYISFQLLYLLDYYDHPINGIDYLKMFRGQFLLSLYLLLVSINIYFWRHYGVNHVLIFELNPRYHLGFTETFAVNLLKFLNFVILQL